MPENYDYAEPTRLLSTVRLSSYKSSFQPQNDAQLFGAYCWNLAVVSAFYPLLQMVEVCLRNTLNQVAAAKYQRHDQALWFSVIPAWQDHDFSGCEGKAEQVRKFCDNIKIATKSAKRNLEGKGITNPTPTLDQIISQSDFSTWEYLLDKHFYDGADKRFLWPHELTKAFRKLPRLSGSKNPMFHQRDIIRRRIEEVRAFRNRISHNEPAWRVGEVKNRQDVIAGLTEKLEKILELVFWISPKFRKYVADIGVESRVRQVLNIHELDRYMQLYKRQNIRQLRELSELLTFSNSQNLRCYFMLDDTPGILSPCTTSLLQ
ncbi:hypothetical protein [Pseudocitrobacter faecalis]|uniref:Abi-like protein n=1 Tax=Pseudocitrobacter faecalis TaxID=1398493 RepID=A0ABX9FU98_9ENTR|nr:hypothetical protein DFQ50_106290 [Pseudocitrobacter faecalis]